MRVALLRLIEWLEWKLQQARSLLFPTCHHHDSHAGERAFWCADCGAYRSRRLPR